MGPAISNYNAPPTVHPAPPGPIPNCRFYRLHLTPPLIRREGNNAGPSAEPDADDSAAPVTTSSLLSPTSVPPRRFFPSRRPELLWSPAPESATPNTDAGSGMGAGTPAAEPDTVSRRAVAAHVPLVGTQQCAPLAPATAAGRFARSTRCTALAPWQCAATRIAASPAAATSRSRSRRSRSRWSYGYPSCAPTVELSGSGNHRLRECCEVTGRGRGIGGHCHVRALATTTQVG
jgi:hypothetical protein